MMMVSMKTASVAAAASHDAKPKRLKVVSIDPRQWLAEQGIEVDTSASDRGAAPWLTAGNEAIAIADGDIAAAISRAAGMQFEIILAHLLSSPGLCDTSRDLIMDLGDRLSEAT